VDSALVLIAFGALLAVLVIREADHARERNLARQERERILSAAAAERAQLLDRIMARDYQQYAQGQAARATSLMPPFALTDEQEAQLEEARTRYLQAILGNGQTEV